MKKRVVTSVVDSMMLDRIQQDQMAKVVYFVECNINPWSDREISVMRDSLSKSPLSLDGYLGTAVCYPTLDTGYTHYQRLDPRSYTSKGTEIIRNVSLQSVEGRKDRFSVDEAIVDPILCKIVKDKLFRHSMNTLRHRGLIAFAREPYPLTDFDKPARYFKVVAPKTPKVPKNKFNIRYNAEVLLNQ